MENSILKVENIHKDVVPISLYEALREEKELQDKWLKVSVARQLETLEKENSELRVERDSLRGQLEQVDKHIRDIKEQADKRVKELENKHESGRERQKGVWESRLNDSYIDIRSKEAEIKRLKQKISELETSREKLNNKFIESEALLKSRDEEIERLKSIESKIDTLYELLTSNLEEIKDMINSNKDKSEILETIEEMEETVKRKKARSKEEIEAENKEIIRMINEGMTDKEIANIIFKDYSSENSRKVALSKRKNTKGFKGLLGGN